MQRRSGHSGDRDLLVLELGLEPGPEHELGRLSGRSLELGLVLRLVLGVVLLPSTTPSWLGGRRVLYGALLGRRR